MAKVILDEDFSQISRHVDLVRELKACTRQIIDVDQDDWPDGLCERNADLQRELGMILGHWLEVVE